MKTKNKLLKGMLIGAILLSTNILVAQTNTSPVQTVCAGSTAEPYLINPPTPGSTYQWSLSGGGTLTNGVSSDNITVDWGVTAGVYTVTVTETDVNGCSGAPRTVDVTVQALPIAPAVTNELACEGGLIPDLTATGTALTWYDDAALTNQVGVGNNFSTLQTGAGLYTYYATESLNGCEGPSVPVTLEIYALPLAPAAVNEVACEGALIPDLTATGTALTWYDDLALTNQLGAGINFATGQTIAGVYTYYVSETDLNTCESNATTVTLEIYALPLAPAVVNEVACEGGLIPDLTATGTALTWYDDFALTNQVGTGSNFATGQTLSGAYTYYVSEIDLNTCESNATTVTLEIYSLPNSPVATNESACFGTTIPPLSTIGTPLTTWYDDSGLTNVVQSGGNSYLTGQTAVGVYTYYITDTDANGCESNSSTVALEIYALPLAPAAVNQVACEGGLVPDLTATGIVLTWYDDATLVLTSQVGTGSNFATGQTVSGVYTYYVIETDLNSCGSIATPVTLEIYTTPTTGPISHW
jgi:hypothetical protein